MRKPITFAVVFIIAFSITSTGQPLNNAAPNTNSKRIELPEGTEAAKAIARLGNLSSETIRERLQQMRPLDYRPGSFLVNKIVAAQHLPIVNNKRVDQLKAALQPVLDYHGRSKLPIVVLRSEQPKAYLVERAAIIITTRMIAIASEEEIRGILAHELGHEYVWEERFKALAAKDWQLIRECELFCDAVAAFTLKEMGHDPASYGRILIRLMIIGIRAGNATQHESDTHPSLDARKKLNKFLCERLD